MGDMLRDGYWNDSNYIVGQETELLNDAKEILEVMSQPVASYTLDVLDLFESGGKSIPMLPEELENITLEHVNEEVRGKSDVYNRSIVISSA
ncbi:MAG: hypothetical protein GX763_05855, partial [Clostridiaceae bacterium]|nr:hypothetical protein [Clostridiaceae bacterium]